MELKNIGGVNLNTEVMRQAQIERSPIQADKQVADAEEGARKSEYRSKKRSEIRKFGGYTDRQYDYTVNADHDLVIKVKERNTNKEIRQIPSREAQAYKRAFREIVDKLLDIKV